MDIYNALEFLKQEIDRNIHIIKRQDDKLKEILPEDEYIALNKELAKETFEDWINHLPKGGFKDFVEDNAEDFMNDDLWEDEE